VTGYDVYRSTVSGGPYTEITSAVSATEYTDDSVQAGTDYFYVVTSVSSNGTQSGYSSQIEAQIP
jgi:fibronectin type 3 domain-containing protein